MTLPTDLIFWILVPVLFAMLFFCWLVYLARGGRSTRVTLSGLGISLSISSQQKDDDAPGAGVPR